MTTTVEESFSVRPIDPHLRQQILILYLGTSALDSNVIGWTRYDGTGRSRRVPGRHHDLEPFGAQRIERLPGALLDRIGHRDDADDGVTLGHEHRRL